MNQEAIARLTGITDPFEQIQQVPQLLADD